MGVAVRAAAVAVFLCAFGVAAPAQAALSASLQGSTLTITGDGASDKLTINGNGTNLDLDYGSDGTVDQSFPRASITATVANMGDGDDTVLLTSTLPSDGITVNGEAGADTLTGGSAPETLNGGDGADVIDGHQGNDLMNGGAGDDSFRWDPGDGSDTLNGGDGEDSLQFNGANIAEQIGLNGNGGRAQLTRDVGTITLDIGTIENLSISLVGGADTYTGGTGAASAAGLFHSILVNGGTGGDTLNGGDADETLVGGGTDADTVNGGAGNDTFPRNILEATADTVDGGAGIDTLEISGLDYSETYTVDSAGAGMAAVTQSPDFGSQTANGIENVALETLGGNDTVSMTAAGAANLTLDASGGPGQDVLTGGQGADILHGDDGADRLSGQQGNDQLFGDAGVDVLTGGLGADSFNCGGFGDSLVDVTADDSVAADCLPPSAPTPTPTPQPTPQPPPTTIVVPAFVGVTFSGSLRRLTVQVVNRHSAAVRLRLTGSESDLGAKKVRFKAIGKTVGAGRSATFTIKTPTALRRALAAAIKKHGKVVRRPRLTLTNVDTHGTLAVGRPLTLKR